MTAYRKFILLPSVSEILSADDVQRAVAAGADEMMNRVEFLLRNRPLALRQARQDYIALCAQLYMAALEASR